MAQVQLLDGPLNAKGLKCRVIGFNTGLVG